MSTRDGYDDSPLDEEIRQFSNNLEGIRKRRRLVALQTQIAEEGRWLQEAQERLDKARQSVGPDASGSTSLQSPVGSKSPIISKSPVFSIAPGQDTSSAVDALIKSVLDPIGNNMPPVNSSPPTTDQPRMVNGDVKLVSTASVRRGKEAAPASAPSEYSPDAEGASNEGKDKVSSENGHEAEKLTDAVPSQRRLIAQPTSPRTHTQTTPARRIPATPPSPSGLDFGSYRGRNWKEWVQYVNALEAHFARYPSYYTEARKVELGAKYIGHNLMNQWHDHIMRPGNTSWNSYCTFLAQQLSRRASREQASFGITTAEQKTAQPVTRFAFWLIQWAPVLPEVSTKEFMVYLLRGAPSRNS
ncbi:uncharacterized protein N7473_004375 [Penicillium subrubescens]|uniref:uncharacterized protein n=1 Tax=Penicillium subrubescens TaxID=1316194 RepID=UPI002545B4D8|nr:uncharacterized protein N7473_004375 [Penicillium subrubescens]KAJ5900305.1 hypothetical protein N7473_004375 [Penicillium subrubescens]